MKLTHDLIMQHRTSRGGWRKAQIQALGLTWLPGQGWVKDVIGMVLSDHQLHQLHQFTGKNPAQLDLLNAVFSRRFPVFEGASWEQLNLR